MSGLTAKPDRPCFYLKTTLPSRGRGVVEETERSRGSVAVVLEGVLLKSRAGPARGGVETTAAAAAAAAWTSAAVAACVAGYRGFWWWQCWTVWGWVGGGSLAPTEEMVGIRLPSEAGVRLRRRRGGGIGC